MGLQYLNFDLWIWKTWRGYEASANSPAGGAGPVPFPSLFSGGVVRAAPAGEPLKASGRRLFNFVFQGEARRKWDQCRMMANRSSRMLRLRLSLQSSELWEWPWESLYDHGFLALSPEFSVTRWIPIPKPASRPRLFFNTRVLVVVDHSENCARVSVEREIGAIEESLQGRVELTVLHGATSGQLQAAFTKPVHILHYIGHAPFAREKGSPRSRSVCEGEWSIAVKQKVPGLVVLNVPPGRSLLEDVSVGVAQRLSKEGVPAALALRFPESGDAAVSFNSAFYGSLAAGDPVERAVWRGRHRLAAHAAGAEWLNPVLHLAGSRCLPIRLRRRRIPAT
jgi:hypothetical protein